MQGCFVIAKGKKHNLPQIDNPNPSQRSSYEKSLGLLEPACLATHANNDSNFRFKLTI